MNRFTYEFPEITAPIEEIPAPVPAKSAPAVPTPKSLEDYIYDTAKAIYDRNPKARDTRYFNTPMDTVQLRIRKAKQKYGENVNLAYIDYEGNARNYNVMELAPEVWLGTVDW